jgi:phosphotransferase system  glucose/maltose/N-acetylglucosamine-specific IIC component
MAITIWMGLAQFIGYILFLPIGFQRYYLVFIPLSLLIFIYGIHLMCLINRQSNRKEGSSFDEPSQST